MADTQNTSLPKKATAEIGQSGTMIYGGMISQEEYNKNLVGRAGILVYEEMRKSDSNVRGALRVVKQPVLSLSWDINAATDQEGVSSSLDEKAAALCKQELLEGKVKFRKVVREILTKLDFGFSLFEKVYCPSTLDGSPCIGLEKIAFRKQKTIMKWEITGEKPGVVQQVYSGSSSTVEIPREKLALFVNEQEGDNWQGVSLLRYMYKDWHMKKTMELVNAIKLERQGTGIPYAQAREGQTPSPQDEAAAEDWLKSIRANSKASVKLPSSMEAGFMDMHASSTADALPTLSYHKRGVWESVLATFMDLGGSSGSGAQALSKDLTAMFMKAEEELVNSIVEVIQDDIIKQLCDLNFAELPNGYPKLTHGDISDDDVAALATALSSLSTAGLITPDAEMEDDLRTRYRLPKMAKDMKENYDELKAPPTAEPSAPIDKNNVDEVIKTTPKDAKKAAVIADAKKVQRRLIDVLVN